MCGIAICFSTNPDLKTKFAQNAIRHLHHRGPDGDGVWMDDQIALVHTRLAILDTSDAGSQPMVSLDGRFVISYNGEIYNHLELRKRFLSDVEFKGHSDTETLLYLYDRLGEGMLKHMVGMWAFGIWDTLAKTLFISRDRFQQKPLYWTKTGENDWFLASEMKALLPIQKKRTLNNTAAVEYLALGNYGHLGEDTFINEIKSFPPAHFAFIKPSSNFFQVQPYWEIPQIKYSEKRMFGANESSQLKEVIKQAVISQTLSDVPIGMTLSGGIDSSVIAGILARHSETPIEVFSALNTGNRYDESPYAKLVMDHWQQRDVLKFNFIEMNTLSISKDLEAGLMIQEEPFGDPSILSHYRIMEAVQQKGIKVILGGQGADEIFFGYDNMFHGLAGSLLRKGKVGLFNNLVRQLHLSKSDIMKITMGVVSPGLYLHSRKKSRHMRRFFIQKEFVSTVLSERIHLARIDDFYDTWIESIRGVHLPHLVHYDDRNGMAVGVEGRMPFLDHRIIELLATIRPESFAQGGVRKFLLKESCTDYLPPAIKARQDKIGFFAPIHEMIIRDIEFLNDEFRTSVFPLEIIDKKVLLSDLDSYGRGEIDVIKARRIWRVYSLCKWMKMFIN